MGAETFVKRWKSVTEAVTSKGLEEIFAFLEPVQQEISLLSFKLAFFNEETAEPPGLRLPPDIEK